MRTAKKTAIIVAVIFIIAGGFLAFCALVSLDFDVTKLNTMNMKTNEYVIEHDFNSISVEGVECDIRLFPTADGSCHIVCEESDGIHHTVSIEEGALKIRRIDDRRWYEHIGFGGKTMGVSIYLPQGEYQSLYVVSVSGDVEIPNNFSFTDAELYSTSGDIHLMASVQKDISVKTVSGDIKLTSVDCQNVTAESVSGDIDFGDVIASKTIRMESVSGDVKLLACDAEALWIKTTSGSITGRLLTEKIFQAKSVRGDIHVPNSTSGGKCEVGTTSGDIKFDTP